MASLWSNEEISSRPVRLAVIGSWLAFAIPIAQTFPIVHSKWLLHLFYVPITLLGFIAGIAAAVGSRRWRAVSGVAAIAFVTHWLVWLVVDIASRTDTEGWAGAIAYPFTFRWYILGFFAKRLDPWFFPLFYTEVAMPSVQIGLLVYLWRRLTTACSGDAPQAVRA